MQAARTPMMPQPIPATVIMLSEHAQARKVLPRQAALQGEWHLLHTSRVYPWSSACCETSYSRSSADLACSCSMVRGYTRPEAPK